MTKIAAWQFGTRTCAAIANASRDAFARTEAHDVEIEVGFARDERVLLGAFQRACDVPDADRARAIVRGTPGAAVRVGRGTLVVLVSLARIDCDESQILNRHVRPILRALRRVGCAANYFGRDWIAVGGRPVGHVGFAHERAPRDGRVRAVVEAFVAVRGAPFAVTTRASHRGKTIATLEELRGKPVDDDALVARVVDELGAIEDGAIAREPNEEERTNADPPWSARVEEAIGPVCAGRDARGVMRVGGEFMASFDAVRDLEDRVESGQEIRSAVNDAFGAPHTALFGVRSLESIARALEDAKNR